MTLAGIYAKEIYKKEKKKYILSKPHPLHKSALTHIYFPIKFNKYRDFQPSEPQIWHEYLT